ncbi:MAG: RpiB/LacA/LacB family sugar-phosphate isomerase [Dysgonamonadaceae bacterium]|jgi:ribose 5-phosphate isomerase B|nr:RpiB/LacA/LacB family sugar-phosphate isomerase [Dysgonamonadaceae bacterium]
MIGLASDHAGYELKQFIKTYLDKKGIAYIDFGTDAPVSCNYADYGHLLAAAVEKGEVYPGIAVCGSGNGINMTVNKHPDIRSALCWCAEIAHLARLHNDANILTLPGRFLSMNETEKILDEFLNTAFEEGRHQARIDSIPVKTTR